MSISTSDILAVLNEKNGNMSLREALWTAAALQELTNIGMRDERSAGYTEGYDAGYKVGKRDGELNVPTLAQQRDTARCNVADIVRKTGSHKKIQCIKQLRELTGLGLKDTKDIVDKYIDGLRSLADWERDLVDPLYVPRSY